MTQTLTAVDRRFAAIRALCDETRHTTHQTVLNPDYSVASKTVVVVWTKFLNDKNTLASDIRGLALLGRTDRWKGAVERWAREVEASTDEKHFRWAFDQYGTYAAYAAE